MEPVENFVSPLRKHRLKPEGLAKSMKQVTGMWRMKVAASRVEFKNDLGGELLILHPFPKSAWHIGFIDAFPFFVRFVAIELIQCGAKW